MIIDDIIEYTNHKLTPITNNFWDGVQFSISGPNWAFSTMCPWRIRNKSTIVITSETQDRILLSLITNKDVVIDKSSFFVPIDPVFEIGNNLIYEIFSCMIDESWIMSINKEEYFISNGTLEYNIDSFRKITALSFRPNGKRIRMAIDRYEIRGEAFVFFSAQIEFNVLSPWRICDNNGIIIASYVKEKWIEEIDYHISDICGYDFSMLFDLIIYFTNGTALEIFCMDDGSQNKALINLIMSCSE